MITELKKEARRLEEDVLFSEKAHFGMATIWSRVRFVLGIPSAILAAAAGASALNQWPSYAALTAIASAVLTALMTFLGPEQEASRHHGAGIRYNVLRGKLRRFERLHLSEDAETQPARAALETLASEKATIMESAPHTGGIAYILARRSIKRQEHAYQADNEER